LVKRLSACVPHYVRCIKSNDRKAALTFNTSRVEHQVKYLGLLENVKVKRAGYAYRHFKKVFLARFGQLMPEETPPQSCSELVNWLCSKNPDLKKDEFEEGKTKIFVRSPGRCA
jgi:myosin I